MLGRHHAGGLRNCLWGSFLLCSFLLSSCLCSVSSSSSRLLGLCCLEQRQQPQDHRVIGPVPLADKELVVLAYCDDPFLECTGHLRERGEPPRQLYARRCEHLAEVLLIVRDRKGFERRAEQVAVEHSVFELLLVQVRLRARDRVQAAQINHLEQRLRVIHREALRGELRYGIRQRDQVEPVQQLEVVRGYVSFLCFQESRYRTVGVALPCQRLEDVFLRDPSVVKDRHELRRAQSLWPVLLV